MAESDRAPVGVGILGSGSVLWAYLRALDPLVSRGLAREGPVAARRKDVWPGIQARRPAIQLVSTVEEVLASDVEVVVIITTPSSHCELALAAIEAGKHVLVEKPLGRSREEAERVVRAGRDAGRHVMAAPFVLLAPTVQHLWRIVAEGKLGPVHSTRAMYGNAGPTWARWFFEEGVGPLGDLAVYNLKTLTAILGPIESVLAAETVAVPVRLVAGTRLENPQPDTVHLICRHRSGTLSSLLTSHAIQQYRRPAIELYGTEGTANLLGDDHAPAGIEVWSNEEASWRFFPPQDLTWSWTDGLRELVAAVREERPPLQELEQDLHLIDVLAATRKAARTGSAVAVSSSFPDLPLPAGPSADGHQHVHDPSRPLDEQF